jgi:hypothetical protein
MEKKKKLETIGDVAVTVIAVGIGTMVASVCVIFLYSMVMAMFD